MMGTHQRQADYHHHQHNHDDHGVMQSSIALLQERFKQLQRVKEMREKKELLRIFSNHNIINNNNNNNNNNTISTTILSTNTATTTATISTTDTNNFNSSNNIPRGTAMQCNYPHEGCSNDDGDDKELQVFLPPNYYNHKPSFYSSPSPSSSSSSSSPCSSASPSSSSSLSSNDNYQVSLSLWPSTSPCNVTAAADHFQRTASFIRPTKDQAMGRPCVTRAFKIEDSHHHVSDVDTTLHL